MQSLAGGQVDYSPFKNLREGSIVGGNTQSIIQAKRKKFRELLYGGSLTRTNTSANGGTYVEKETLQNEKRNLKIEMNCMREENLKLKTRVQMMT